MTCWRRLHDGQRAGVWQHVVVDRQGAPLCCLLSSANYNDNLMLAATLDAIPPIRRPRGRSQRRPDKLHADKAYDYPACRRSCRRRHINARIARRGIARRDRLGRHRWVVERTLAWLNRFRRFTTRYERRADIHRAFLTLDCAPICFQQLTRFC
jgi:transposase